jgi:hypothetical protein
MSETTNVRGGDVNPDQLLRWFEDRKELWRKRGNERAARRRVIPHANALENLVRLEAKGKLDDQTKAAVIAMAGRYARQNKLPFDNTLTGAMRLAGEANKIVRDHVAACIRAEENA